MARTISLLVIALLIVLLAALNWTTLASPTLISLGVTSVTAPLGLIMLGLTVLLAILFVAYVLTLQGSVLFETRRHHRDLQAQRDLAEKAEASRLADLRTVLETRMDRLEQGMARHFEQSDNSTAAQLGQIEDRLARGGTGTVYPPTYPPTV
jgi:hypothetical protein